MRLFPISALTCTFFSLTLSSAAMSVEIGKTKFDWAKPQTFKVQVSDDKIFDLTFSNNLFKIALGKQQLQILIDNTKADNDFVGSGLVRVGDLNFDGFNDLAIDTSIGYGGVNVFSRVFFWRPQSNDFSQGLDISNFELTTAKKQLESAYKSGPFYYRNVYKFSTGKPYRFTETIAPGPVKIVTVFDPNGKRIKRILTNSQTDNPDQMKPAILKIVGKTYLYKKPIADAKTKSYLIKGDKVETLDVSAYPHDWYKVRYLGKSQLVRWIKVNSVE